MDVSVSSLNRSTFEERQKNISYLRSMYFLLALQLLVAVGWVWILFNWDGARNFVQRYWGITLAVGIIAVLLILAVYFVPALNLGGAGIGIYALFTILAAWVWGYFCTVDLKNNIAWYILLLLTAIAIGFAAYTL